MRRSTIIVAIIGAAAAIIAALIQIYPSLRNQNTEATIAGIVVDQSTNRGVAQATVTLAGRTEQYVTEDSGNFRIKLRSDAPKSLRLHVTKTGFEPLDMSIESPADNLVLPLRRQ